jgi:PST family polysaccharide transporter
LDDDKHEMKVEDTNESRLIAAGVDLAHSPEGGLSEENGDPNERHFNTDHLRTNLKNRTVSSGFVTLTAQGAKFALTIASTYVLSRLLEIPDFGLLAMVTTIMGLLRVFKDAGLSSATVQRDDITHAQVSNLFWINVGVAGLLALIMAASAPAIAWFYREPKLVGITLWLSVTFLISGSTVQHQALLRRQMRFKAMAVIEVGSMTVSLIVGVLMAWLGCGYWALVGMNLALEASGFALTWWVSRWRPQRPRRGSGTWSLLNFGINMTAGSAVYIFSRGADTMLIGWRYGADATGLYSRALALLMRPLDQLMAPVGAVFIPTLSRLQNDPERYRRAFLRLYEAMALVSFGFSGIFFALSRPITLWLLGPKWEAAAVIFKAFALAALYFPIGTAVVWAVVSQGRGKEFLRINLITSVITISAFVAGLPFGPVGVAFAFSIAGLLVSVPVTFYLAGRRGSVRTRDLWAGFFRHLPLWAVVAGVTALARARVADFSPFIQLLLCGPIGLAAGVGTILAIKPQREVAAHLVGAVRGMLAARRAAGTT